MYSNKRAHKTTHCTKESENFLVIFCGKFLPLLNKMAIPIKGGGAGGKFRPILPVYSNYPAGCIGYILFLPTGREQR
jgi:hypothetical protein